MYVVWNRYRLSALVGNYRVEFQVVFSSAGSVEGPVFNLHRSRCIRSNV